MNIGLRIAEFRRKKGATQEQLANYAGVSVAAVSKWETESSYPDITLLPAIAEYLNVSIDSLMDFDLANGNAEMLRDPNNKYLLNGDYNAGLPLYEEAVRRHPNDSAINEHYARLLSVKAFSSSAPDVEGAKKAVFHYEKSIQLYGTGHENINMIRQHIAFIYGSIGEYGRAIDYLTQTGEGTHEVQIADYTLKMGNYDEAKLRLQSVLFNFAFNFCWLTGTLMKCFEREGDAATVLKLTKLNAEFREYFANSDSPNYFDDLSSFDFSRLAAEYKKAGDHEAMWDALSKAVSHAVRFDTNPSYDLSNVGFMKGYKGYVSNSSSHQACLPLIRYIEENFSEFKDNPRYTEFVHELRKAQSDKKQSGIWE